MNTKQSPDHWQFAPGGALAVCIALLTAALVSVPSVAAQAAKATHPAQKPAATAPAAQQKLFSSPEDARDALIAAATAQDQDALAAIFGPEHDKLRSGDPVEDKRHSERFALHVQEGCALRQMAQDKYTLLIGTRQFPFPIPIVKDGDKWRFDTHAGIDEILNRRIGENELSAIMTCRAYVLAQWEFFLQSGNHNEDGLAEYAEKFISTPGMHDGLYWDTAPDEDPSPLGPLVAAARAEGYRAGRSAEGATVKPTSTGSGASTAAEDAAHPRSPYHGYHFKILTRQGSSAPGGGFSYLINGHMIAGFALIAYPAEWGQSGVMTFIVNTQGRVYEKNLGPKTAELAAAVKEYNPDPTWKLVPKE